jgi:hypothetical protein
MPTAQERYDIERNRDIKNVPLLKILKAQIAKSYNAAADIAQIRLEIQGAANLSVFVLHTGYSLVLYYVF